MRQSFALPTMAIAAVFSLTACSGDDMTGPTTQRGTGSSPEPAAPIAIDVTVRTTGAALDADGYSLGIDGQFTPVGTQEMRTIDGLAAGTHTIWLSGVAANCEVSGPAVLRLDVAAGGSARADFEVECTD